MDKDKESILREVVRSWLDLVEGGGDGRWNVD